jgi:hypothetical protein
MSAKRGPWGLAALLPYTLGASVGAAGNLALAVSVGRAATRYFATEGGNGNDRKQPRATSNDPDAQAEMWEAEFLSERFLDES